MSLDKNGMKIGIILIVVGLVGLSLFASSFPWGVYPIWGPDGSRDTFRGQLTLDDAVRIAEDCLELLGNEDLAIDEIMEFELNFYVVYYEKSTGIEAFEMIIDKPGTGGMMRGMMGMMGMMGNGDIRPEQGPNMMWNTKYGMHSAMGGRDSSKAMTIGDKEARENAQSYLDKYLPGAVAEDVHPFYGYYTIHVLEKGEISGMLSVNGYDGQVWYHSWHGDYVQSREMHEH